MKAAGISGFTYYYVFGGGEQNLKGSEQEQESIKFRVLVPKLVAMSLMKVISEAFFEKEKVIIFEHDANIIRKSKFNQVDYGQS